MSTSAAAHGSPDLGWTRQQWFRRGITGSTADDTAQLMAQVSTTGIAGTPGFVRKSDTSISRATIDNASWAYWLQCQINRPGGAPNVLGIVGAEVTYTISSTNG